MQPPHWGYTPRRSDTVHAFRGLRDLVALTAALDPVTSVTEIAPSTSMWTAPRYELALRTVVWAADRRKRSGARHQRRARRNVPREPPGDRSRSASPSPSPADRPIVRGMPARSSDADTVVDESGRVVGVADVYAIGDMTGRRTSAIDAITASEGDRRGHV